MGWNRRQFLARAGTVAALPVCGKAGDAVPCQQTGAPELEFLKKAFVYGREYFVLRSGRIKLVVQADRAGTSPGFLWLAFDGHDNRQTRRKENALNFGDGTGFLRSALEVVLGGFPFTAVGHETITRWVQIENIPAVEASWWAGGLLVTECLIALSGSGDFLRRITLASRNLGGTEEVSLRLSLPAGGSPSARLSLDVPGASVPVRRHESGIEIGPLSIPVGGSVSVDTRLSIEISGEDPHPEIGDSLRRTDSTWATVSSLSTADTTIRELFDKARFGLSAMVADNGAMDAGIFEYGAQWVRDTSNTLIGLIHAGHFELARRGFAHVLANMVNEDGKTMIGSAYDDPDREQFDQMGELLHGLAAYLDWTGDDSLIREYHSRLIALIERPLRTEFRHSSGMVHNRREFWERTLEDGLELAYQTYVTLGLREAASLARELDATDRAGPWRRQADSILNAMLSDPVFALVEQGRLIKRRAIDGTWVRELRFPGSAADVPLKTERVNLADPDSTTALPIALGLIDPRSALARNTLDELERLWNARWFGGGYERYHSSGQADQPGPWTFATCFILRAQHDAGLYDRSRRTLEWLNTVQGGRTGAWFEEIPLVRSQSATAGVLPWTSGEVSLFIVRHLLGVRFDQRRLVLRPSLAPASPPVLANLRFRKSRLALDIRGAGPFRFALVNGRRVDADANGAVTLDSTFDGGSVVFGA